MKYIKFLPLWYRNKTEIKNYNRYKIVIVLMVTFIAISSGKFIKCKNYCNDISDKIKYTNEKFKVHNECKTTKSCGVETYLKLNEQLFNKVNVSDISINNNTVSIEAIFDNMINTTEVIKYVEEKKYNIESINIENLDENKVLLKLNFKVGKHE